jgi:hypothetical protein
MIEKDSCMQAALNPVFVGLPDILQVRRIQEQEDGECFTTLQEVFTAHGMCERFTVTLLHTHFLVYEHEILVDSPHLQNRSILTEAVPSKDTAYLPCSWRLMQTGSAYEFAPNQYIALPDGFDGSGYQLTTQDEAFFAAVAATLRTYYAESRFGLRLFFPFHEPRQGEYLVERTDTENRILELMFAPFAPSISHFLNFKLPVERST